MSAQEKSSCVNSLWWVNCPMFCSYVFVLLCNILKRRQCSLFKIFRIMCLLLLRILFQPVGKLPEQWDENQHKSHGSHSASVASGLCYFIQHSAFTALRYMKFTILMKMDCYVWIFGLSSDEMGSILFFWYWNTVFFMPWSVNSCLHYALVFLNDQ